MNAKNDRVVCVVDDDEAVRDSLLVLLQAEGVPACVFASAAELLADFDLAAAVCFVLDVHMPGMDGIALLGELRRRGVKAPIYLLTGRADPVLRAEAATAGATAVLSKPSAELLSLVLNAIGRT